MVPWFAAHRIILTCFWSPPLGELPCLLVGRLIFVLFHRRISMVWPDARVFDKMLIWLWWFTWSCLILSGFVMSSVICLNLGRMFQISSCIITLDLFGHEFSRLGVLVHMLFCCVVIYLFYAKYCLLPIYEYTQNICDYMWYCACANVLLTGALR